MRACIYWVLMVALVGGCRRDESGSPSLTSTVSVGPVDLYARTGVEFADVGFFKPREGSASERLVGLGSLIVQEVVGAEATVDRFGAVYTHADGSVVAENTNRSCTSGSIRPTRRMGRFGGRVCG